tara:strand:- start:282 stop:1736 length:1455 start_codon:yes stop_codon:yes gene_type:complete
LDNTPRLRKEKMAQGFVKNANLVESASGISDRAILDNLAGTNITSDILLLDGNFNLKSSLSNTPNSPVDADTPFGSLITATKYRIKDVGVTRNWNGIGADASPAVGEIFTATGAGDTSSGIGGLATEVQVRTDFQNVNYPVDGYTIVVIGDNRVGFSEGTILSIDGGANYDYKVYNSNGEDRFQLIAKSDTAESPTIVNLESIGGVTITDVSLTRDDSVHKINIEFLSPGQDNTNSNVVVGAFNPEVEGDSDGDDDYSTFQQTSYIGSVISKIKFKKTRIPLTYQDNSFSENVRIRGQVRITNTNNLEIGYPRTIITALVTNEQYKIIDKGNTIDADWTHIGADASPAVGEIFTANGATTQADSTAISGIGSGTVKAVNPPGLFILNSTTNQEVRAFSGTENPWEEVASGSSPTGAAALKTVSNKAQISKLLIDSPVNTPVLIKTNIGASAKVDLVASVATTTPYTHKLPIVVNGEQFYLLLDD